MLQLLAAAVAIMNEKGNEATLDHNEKVPDPIDRSSSELQDEQGGLGRRRKSVALNIVENPLSVSILPVAWKTLAFANIFVEKITRTSC